jgi:hypothetical protein
VKFEKLRDEIVESQKTRTDLIKWKLVLVAAIGAFALDSNRPQPNTILLTLIPFVCLYVDAVCFHNDIRIMAIGRFLRTQVSVVDEETLAYERYCSDNRASFNLEAIALQGATLALSFLVLLLGLSGLYPWLGGAGSWLPAASRGVWAALAFFGGGGIVVGWLSYRFYGHKMRTLDGKAGWWLAVWVNRKLGRAKPAG